MKREGDESLNKPDTSDLSSDDLQRLIAETDLIEAAMQAAARDAYLLHKWMGQPIVVWEDGNVVLIPADEIKIPHDPKTH